MTGTKQKILDTALDLFSEYGYNAVSVKQLAYAVGIKAPSLYKHFSSKQEIFEKLIEYIADKYESNTILPLYKGGDIPYFETLKKLSADEIADVICRQTKYITTDPVISKTRKLISNEQFRDEKIAMEMERRQFADIFAYHRELIKYFVENGIIVDEDIDALALQMFAPVSMEIMRIDRNPAVSEEAEKHIRNHIVLFFKTYGKDKHNA